VIRSTIAAVVMAGWLVAAGVIGTAHAGDFADWLEGVRTDALSRGISSATVEKALTGLEPIPRVIELDRRQPEFTLSFRQYLDRMVTPERIEKARRKFRENRDMISRVQARYGVQGRYLVAFWGVETDFGRLAGGYFPVIGALATLAHDGRRSDFFYRQLMLALRIVDQGHIPLNKFKGSWAGAMGNFQFMPSTFAAHAVDWDGDGRVNIWEDVGDSFASAADFLSGAGWNAGEIWGREVVLPDGFDYRLAGMGARNPIAEWQRLGVRRPGGRDLPAADMKGSVIVPAGHRGPAFLVYDNFNTIMAWNNSVFYALAVGYLADRLVGLPPLTTKGPEGDRGLTRAEALSLQERLMALGYDVGKPDGIIGPRTRSALAAFEQRVGLVPDGHPDSAVLERLKKGL
jgi:membrane-bound lytic murein transglycosylase B